MRAEVHHVFTCIFSCLAISAISRAVRATSGLSLSKKKSGQFSRLGNVQWLTKTWVMERAKQSHKNSSALSRKATGGNGQIVIATERHYSFDHWYPLDWPLLVYSIEFHSNSLHDQNQWVSLDLEKCIRPRRRNDPHLRRVYIVLIGVRWSELVLSVLVALRKKWRRGNRGKHSTR